MTDFRKVIKSKLFRHRPESPLHKVRYIPIAPDTRQTLLAEEPPLDKPDINLDIVEEKIEVDSVIHESRQLFLQARR